MLATLVARVVDSSRRFALPIALGALIATVLLGGFVATHFKINTDINELLSDDLDWRQREADMEKAFPQKVDNLVIVLDGDTADVAENAAALLTSKLSAAKDRFTSVQRPDALP